MGRTVASSNELVFHLKEEDWGEFRRALRREDREALDELFALTRYHGKLEEKAAGLT